MSDIETTKRYIDQSLIPENFEAFSPKHKSPLTIDSLDDDDKELWLIRVPDNIPVEKLAEAKIRIPSDTSSSNNKALGKLQIGKDKYEFFRVPQSSSASQDDVDDNDSGVSGYEMAGLTCLLPQKDGKLSLATKKFAHQLIVNQVVDIPDSTKIAEEIRDRPLEKRQQPEGLKMRFKPYGFDTGAPDSTKQQETVSSVKQEDDEKKSKKRRKEADGGEKPKKKKKKENKE